jgi:phenylpyruvate tautomerase PptA (4-oxalocrotonate tautomerase family)
MPLIRVDMIEGRKPEEIKGVLDAIHRTVVRVLDAPVRDRYQIVHEHPQSRFFVEDTGLDITRTRNCIVIQVTTRPHERQAKVNFYQQLARELEEACGLAPSDLVVCIVNNQDEDWSFGWGRAQYLTGELAS